jgi:UDPglucose 6-dehydrogenase
MRDDQTIAVLGGVGYVGLVTAVGLAQLEKRVVCVDLPAKVEHLKVELGSGGGLDLFEPGFEQAMGSVRDRIEFTSDYGRALAEADLVIVAVGTPSADPDANPRDVLHFHGCDLTAVRTALDSAVDAGLEDRHVIVMKSTVPPGTANLLGGHIQERRLARRSFSRPVPWVSCPEFLQEGKALAGFHSPDRIVVGCDDTAAGDRVEDLFENLETPTMRMDPTSAELVKLGANSLLATKITFANELANLCDRVGAVVDDVVSVLRQTKDIGEHFLRPGVGFGGSCFPKDVRTLRQLGADWQVDVGLLDAVLRANEAQAARAVEKLKLQLDGCLEGKEVAILGLAFKPNTNDTRETRAANIIQQLLELGARVRAFDPHVPAARRQDPDVFDRIEIVRSLDDCFAGADAIVLATEWDDFDNLDWRACADQMKGEAVIDGRCALNPKLITDAGLRYDGIGRRALGAPKAQDGPELMHADELHDFTLEAAGAFRAVKAAAAAEIKSLAVKLGADPERVTHAIGADQRIGPAHLEDGSSNFSEAITAFQRRSRDVGYAFLLVDALEPAAI